MTVDTLVLGYLDNNCYILSNNNKCLIIDPSDNGNVILNAIENKDIEQPVNATHGMDFSDPF